MAGGYAGKILDVDLASGSVREEALDEGLLRGFLGGYGVGARLLYDRMPAGVDPLGPENLLGFFTGPLTGTPAIEGNRFTVVCKSPLTLTWGDANCGGTFGPHLKLAGFDAILFSGISDRPVYLLLEDGRAELRDASDLWGHDTNETEDLLKARHGREAHVASIGPSGEKLALIAAIINDYGRAAGRSGVGAVMGSKRLKAVVAKGKRPIPLANPDKARALRAFYMKQHGGAYDFFSKTGTPGALGESAMSGDSPVRNWAGAGPVDLPSAATKLDGDRLIATYQVRKYGCWRCTMACGGYQEVRHSGPYQGVSGHQSEYETGAMFGINLLNDSYASTIKANDICNRYGLDTISAGAVIAWAMEAFEKGILTTADTDGIELTWGNDAAILATLEKLARREGFGDLLAQGVWRASQQVGNGSEQFAIHIHGQELPAHDPRFQPGFATTYLMDATPGRHTQGGEQSRPYRSNLGPRVDKYQYGGKGEIHAKAANLMHVVNAAGVCQFAAFSYPWQFIPDFLEAVTGWPYPVEECLTVGERIANVRHAFNLREGLNPLEYQVPGRMIGDPPLEAGNVRGVSVGLATQVREFCEAMGWDTRTARPNAQRLEELGLGDICRDLKL
ncbi:MAG: aldehyde ferredoxin oxidoreductase family protein [Sphingomonadaceae bacterium]